MPDITPNIEPQVPTQQNTPPTAIVSMQSGMLESDSYPKNISIKKLYFYSGPNYYLERGAMVFNISFSPLMKEFDAVKMQKALIAKLPRLADYRLVDLPHLFAQTLLEVLKLGIDLCVDKYDVLQDDEEHTIAVEFLDDYVAEEAIYFTANWMEAIINPRLQFNFGSKFRKLQEDYDKGLFGGPTIYALIEAGTKRKVPVNYLRMENQFQWGYGKNQFRGRSTVLDVDGIKDTEFTELKDACKEFLLMCGFPTPVGKTCFTLEEATEMANKLKYPVVAKPVSGHKGQGVTTGIHSDEQLKDAYERVMEYHKEHEDVPYRGVIVEQQIFGKDHRLLAVGGKFAAALEREPAFVIGDGRHTIEELIRIENETNMDRTSKLRAPLAKIKIDDDLTSFLTLQALNLQSVVADGYKLYLRRVANISSGGISINVTDLVHPKNKQLVEDIASFFRVTILGIDVLAEDISKPWTEGNFGIIEINAGPGVFMHLAPSQGIPVDVPGMIMDYFFPTPRHSRIPIIIGNRITKEFANRIYEILKNEYNIKYFGSVTQEGAFFNGRFLVNNKKHDENVMILLRHIGLEFAVFCHDRDAIHDYGIYHSQADIVILDTPNYAEKMLEREMTPDGCVIDIYEDKIEVLDSEKSLGVFELNGNKTKDDVLIEIIRPMLPAIIQRYTFERSFLT